MNGVTFRSHPAGSLTNPGSAGRHCPGNVPVVKPGAPNRPSFARATSIAAAAASPTAIPPVFAGPSGIPATDVIHFAASAGCCAGTMLTSTRYAAVATAASNEAENIAGGDTRYGWYPP